MDRRRQDRELVFCHQCEHEWFKDQNGLVCPVCDSEFTEVIEQDHDPRVPDDYPPNPFRSHNPWTHDAPDPDASDITQSQWRSNSTSPHGSSHPHPSNADPHGMPFNMGRPPIVQAPPSMPNFLGGMMGFMNSFPGMEPDPRQNHGQPEDPSRPRLSPGNRSASVSQTSRGYEFHASSGPGFSFRIQSMNAPLPDDGFNRGDPAVPMSNLLQNILGSIHGGPNGAGSSGPPGIVDFFQHMMNPAGAPAGDFVHSQEALDQILSELMNQHQSGNAPGPASAEAIEALPKKPIDDKILGGAAKADCSICMMETNKGDTITLLPCQHWFHPPCVEAWLKEHDTCPICREGIMPKNESAGNTARTPGEPPLHNEDPFELARQQSGSRENPIVLPETPISNRRTPRLYSSGPPPNGGERHRTNSDNGRRARRTSGTGDPSSGGIGGSWRRVFGGGNSNSGGNGNSSRR